MNVYALESGLVSLVSMNMPVTLYLVVGKPRPKTATAFQHRIKRKTRLLLKKSPDPRKNMREKLALTRGGLPQGRIPSPGTGLRRKPFSLIYVYNSDDWN